MELEGKTISIDVEVVDVALNYNIFLGWISFYAMTDIESSVFFTLQFTHQGKIATIDQLDYCTLDIWNHDTNNVPFLIDSKYLYESVGVGILKDSSLMGTFPLSVPNPPQHDATIHTISTLSQQSPSSYDPRIVPSRSEHTFFVSYILGSCSSSFLLIWCTSFD